MHVYHASKTILQSDDLNCFLQEEKVGHYRPLISFFSKVYDQYNVDINLSLFLYKDSFSLCYTLYNKTRNLFGDLNSCQKLKKDEVILIVNSFLSLQEFSVEENIYMWPKLFSLSVESINPSILHFNFQRLQNIFASSF